MKKLILAVMSLIITSSIFSEAHATDIAPCQEAANYNALLSKLNDESVDFTKLKTDPILISAASAQGIFLTSNQILIRSVSINNATITIDEMVNLGKEEMEVTVTEKSFIGPLVNLNATTNATYDSLGNLVHAPTMLICSAAKTVDSITVTNTKTGIQIGSLVLIPSGYLSTSIEIPLP